MRERGLKTNKWVRETSLRARYYGRIARGWLLRLFLRMCLIVFSLEKIIHPPVKEGHRKILVIVFGGLGDCLLFDPLFRRIKEHWKGARVDVLTGCFESMWEQLEPVDNLIYFTRNNFKTPLAYAAFFRLIYRNRYDIVAEGIAMFSQRGIYPIFTSLVFEASRAPVRIGRIKVGRYAPLRITELGFMGRDSMLGNNGNSSGPGSGAMNPYLTHIINVEPPDRRQYHESAKLFEHVGLDYHRKKNEPRLHPDPYMDLWAQTLIRSEWGNREDIIVGLSVETTRRIKEWPVHNFKRVIEWGIRDNLKFVLLGLAENGTSELNGLFPEDKFLNLSGKTSLAQMIAVIRSCTAFFSCDTGPSHIAQACQVPTVVLFGPSNEMEFGPVNRELHTLILPPGDLPCRPCVLGPCIRGTSCMNLITPEKAYEELIGKARKGAAQPGEESVPGFLRQPQVLYVL